jgi:glycerol-3-phosphate dehydrogenase
VDPGDAGNVMGSLARAFGGDLGPEDVRASWAGIRPLLRTGSGATRDLSRRHVIFHEPPGLITVTGGKLTTYRSMAQDVVDRVCRGLRRGTRSRTRSIPLGLTRPVKLERERAAEAAAAIGSDPEIGPRLVERYGDDWEDALALLRSDPALGEPVHPDLPVLRLEANLARTREMALTDEDVWVRRTRLASMDAAAASRIGGATG